MLKVVFNLVLSANQLPDMSGTEKKAFVMAQLKDLDIIGYNEEKASMIVDIAVGIFKCEGTKKIIASSRTCCRKRSFQ